MPKELTPHRPILFVELRYPPIWKIEISKKNSRLKLVLNPGPEFSKCREYNQINQILYKDMPVFSFNLRYHGGY